MSELKINMLNNFIRFLKSDEAKESRFDTQSLSYSYPDKLWTFLGCFNSIRDSNGDHIHSKYTSDYVNENFKYLDESELENAIFYLVRAERFCEGTIPVSISNGYIEKVIKRLIDLKSGTLALKRKRGRKPGQANMKLDDEVLELCYHMAVIDLPKLIRQEFIDKHSLSNSFHSYFLKFVSFLDCPGKAKEDLKRDKKAKEMFNSLFTPVLNEKSRFNDSYEIVENYFSVSLDNCLKLLKNHRLKLEYGMAYERYEKIAKRSFEKSLRELFFKFYYLENNLEFKYLDKNSKEEIKEDLDKYNFSLINKKKYVPNQEELDSPLELSLSLEKDLRAFYLDMTMVQTFNTVFNYWVENILKDSEVSYSLRPYTLLNRYSFK